MLNYLWGFMILIGTVVGMLTGQIDKVSEATMKASGDAVSLCITMLGIMSMWMGIMRIAKASGMIESLTKAMRPLMRLLFPDIPKDHIVNEYIASNMIANVLGLGWAATPMGLMAMQKLKELNHQKSTASVDMCTFLIINISSLQLIPVNIIAYRSQYGSANPAEILGMALIATAFSTMAGVAFAVIARKAARKR